MINNIRKKINDLSIRYKLFITYLALIATPFFLFLVINLYYTSRDSEEQALKSLQKVIGQTKSILEFKTESVRNVLNVLALHNTVQEMVMKKADYYIDNIGFWIDDNQTLTKVLYIAHNNPDITGIHFYMKEGLAAAAETDEYKLLSGVEGSEWYQRMVKNNYELEWFEGASFEPEGNESIISAVKGVINNQDINNIVGIVRVDIPVKIFRETLDQSLFTESTSAFLINSRKKIICSSSNASITDDIVFTKMLSDFEDSDEESIWKTEKLGKENFLLGMQDIRYTDWKLVLAVPYKDILEFNNKTRSQMILIFIFVAPLTLPLSLLVAASATKRIRRLISHMKKVEHGDFDVSILPGSNDEIGQLINNFNYMLTRMSMLVDDKFKLGREMKNLELKALQAQINPHFLYNTLDLIDWMSIRNKVPEISHLAETLGKFYKLSLSKGEDIVTIRSEIEHVKAYVKIQNMRFEDNIHLEIDIPDNLYQFDILKIILQPLVENAILHGILEKDEEAGIIRISGEMKDNNIILRVQDDGVGMQEDVLKDILTDVQSNEAHGYGVRNINERLKINYGSEYGLEYQNVQGSGTTVIIRIPAARRQ